MKITQRDLDKVLDDKRVWLLYHANTVATSLSFLRDGALLSRAEVERRGVFQTPQKSDEEDKLYGVWDDIFADSVDIHYACRRANVYGPVLFVLSTKSLLRSRRISVDRGAWVTKVNPMYWDRIEEGQRWFHDESELVVYFDTWNLCQQLVFRDCSGSLPLDGFLKRIVLDDPGIGGYYATAHAALRTAMIEGGLNVPIERRVCRDGCRCLAEPGDLPERFDPEPPDDATRAA